MRTRIKGPARFLIAGIMFGTASIVLFMTFTGAKLYGLLGFPLGMLPFSLMMLWFYKRARAGEEALKNSMTFYTGYLFTWLGGSFVAAGFVVPESERGQVLIPSVICLLVGIGILTSMVISHLRARRKGAHAGEDHEPKVGAGAIIGAVMAGIVLVPMFLMSLVAVYHQQWVPAAVTGLPPLLFLTIFGLVRRFGKRKKSGEDSVKFRFKKRL